LGQSGKQRPNSESNRSLRRQANPMAHVWQNGESANFGCFQAKQWIHPMSTNTLPTSIKYPLIPSYNWINRNKMKIKLGLKPRNGTLKSSIKVKSK